MSKFPNLVQCYWISLLSSRYFVWDSNDRGNHPEVFCKKLLLEISRSSQKNNYVRVPFLIKLQAQAQACNFIKTETLIKVFCCEFCKISKNTFSYKTPPVAASVTKQQKAELLMSSNIYNDAREFEVCRFNKNMKI